MHFQIRGKSGGLEERAADTTNAPFIRAESIAGKHTSSRLLPLNASFILKARVKSA
jgi:hypothetical protein